MSNQKKPMYLLSTCLSFNVSNEDERIVYEILKSLGSYAKLFVKTMIYVSFADGVTIDQDETGRTTITIHDNALNQFISMYASDQDNRTGDNRIYLNWRISDRADFVSMHILKQFGNGDKHLIIQMFKECYPFFFMKNATLPKYVKRIYSGAKNTSAEKVLNKFVLDDNESANPIKFLKNEEPNDLSSELPSDEELKLMDIITKGFDL